MSIKLVNDDSLTNVANAIRIKGSISGTLEFPDGFVSAIQAIPSGITPSGTLSITSNGVFDVGSFASADVNVSGGGGISIDDIAMRTISGAVGGSATVVRAYAFDNCVYITEVNFPNAVNIASAVFDGCTKISKVNIPNVSTIYANAFHGCASLKTITLPKTSWIGSSAFRFCSKLESIYLLSTSVVSLAATNVFQYTPISASSYIGHFGSIYVPASLVDAYKSKVNWSAYADRITSYVEG